MENKQTAVEWFAEVTAKLGHVSTYILEKAKAMEKEQIIDATYAAPKTGEDYYNETYGK